MPTSSFGEFFRQRRESLGLSLREFCRRNGFDPGNISRLERDRQKPPQSTGVLRNYAKALKLEPDSPEWDAFFDLAAAETGRIPAPMRGSPAVREQLPEVFRILRTRRAHRTSWVKSLDLELWADTDDAKGMLPQLVRQLIRATADSLVRIDFPAGEGTQRRGWDGVLETPKGNEYVPPGVSGWEVSAEKDPRAKAQKVFRDRMRNPCSLDRSQTSFVFVTPRKWEQKGSWSAEKKTLGIWRDVRVYDSADLEQWLEIAPRVDLWFARHLGRRPDGIMGIDEHWANLAALADRAFDPKVFLTSREKQIETLKAWLDAPTGELAFESPSPDETLDFVAACVASLPEQDRGALEARIVVVRERNAWDALCATQDSFILIAKPPLALDGEIVAEAIRQGHHVIVSKPRFPDEGFHALRLTFVARDELNKALVESGFDEEEARRLAQDSGGGLTVLKRLASRRAGLKQPEWSRPPESTHLAPILLAGGWDDACGADRAVLERLGAPYEQVLSAANRWANSDDPPVMRVLTRWILVSRLDSWLLLAPNLTRQQLDSFEEVAIEVLGQDDPRLDLPADERWRASLQDKLPMYSEEVRTGLAETLVLLAARSPAGLVQDPVEPASRAERVVRALLTDPPSWHRWASLSGQLPLLAEACPEAFLDAVEADLRRAKPVLQRLFIASQEGDTFSSACLHAGLLWALETLAWEPSLLARVSLILARLERLYPGPKWANRPFNSLQEVFRPWFPQTAASVEQRVAVLKSLTRRFDDVGWRLLLVLLPTLPDRSMPTHRPVWRDWTLGRTPGATNTDYWEQVLACADLLLGLVGSDVERWRQLIDHFEQFPQSDQRRVLDRLNNLDPGSLETEARRRLADSLREKGRRLRGCPYTNSVPPSDTIDKLEAIQKRFQPDDLVARHLWLFVAYPQLARESCKDSWREHGQAVFQLRRKALEEILAAEGFERVLALARASEAPQSVGYALGKTALLGTDGAVLPSLLTSGDGNIATFASGYALGRFDDLGWDWVEELPLAQWSPDQAGTLVVSLQRFDRRTWQLVERLGDQAIHHYWSRVRGFCGEANKDDVEYAVSMLLRHGRPFQAVDVIAMALHQKCDVASALLLETLEAGRDPPEGRAEEVLSNHVRHGMRQIFELLQSSSGVDRQRLASLEWAYLALLDGPASSPSTLLHLLRTDPKVFVKLLAFLFRSKNEPSEPTEARAAEDKARAENAFRLLKIWRTVPGTRDDDTVGEQELMQWVAAAREMCAETGRLEVCDISIGEVLAHAPKEADGSWPSIPVRDVIEEIDSEEIVRGFQIGIFNKRGAWWKSLTEGGEQTRALAEKYASWAEACNIEWPRTAAALRTVARRYEEEARREDEEARGRL